MTVRETHSFRGISERLTVRYLERLGGERVGDAAVAGDGWRAQFESATATVGPTLTLTEVTVTFEGEADVLEELIPEFSQKAMRAGG